MEAVDTGMTGVSALPLLYGTCAAWAFAVLLWVFSIKMKNVSIVDLWWSQFFVILSSVYMTMSSATWEPRSVALAFCLILWAFRLSGFLYIRNRGQGEDRRYQAIRANYGQSFWWQSLWIIFLLQATLAITISAPLYFVFTSTTQNPFPNVLDYIAIVLWFVGFIFESVGDYQMMRFRAKVTAPDAVCRDGLWNWTRHPNYFGDALQWWGFFLFACNYPNGVWTVFSPALMTYLLLKFSGVTLLENDLAQRKPAYEAYKREVPAFIPRPPKR